jgi:glycosyltransferase involved in cell wall biosynthesis
MISIVCPSRGRPELAKRMIDTALFTAGEEIEILLYLNDDDPTLPEYIKLIDSKYYSIGPDRSPGYSWNMLANQASGEIIFLIGDDVTFITDKWPALVNSAFDQYPDKIVCVYPIVPGLKRRKNPHFCLHKDWINTLGYFVPPHFWHWYVDTWIREVAIRLGRYHPIDEFQLPIILEISDDTAERKDRLCLRERDNWMWEKTQRYIDADVRELEKFIRSFI